MQDIFVCGTLNHSWDEGDFKSYNDFHPKTYSAKNGSFDQITPLTMLTSRAREYCNEEKIFWTDTKPLPHVVQGHKVLLLGNVTIMVKINVAGHEKDNHGWCPPIFAPLKQWSSRKWIGGGLETFTMFLDQKLISDPGPQADTWYSPESAPN